MDDFTEAGLYKSLRKQGIPEYMHEGLVAWVRVARPVGDFLTYLLDNDLKEAAFTADETNRRLLYEYSIWMYNFAPGPCSGSPEKTKAWRETGGMAGLERKAAEEGE
jgi:hypothetical protein